MINFRKILRRRPKRLGVALGGGAARGLAHIGVLKALSEAKIPISYLAGVSSGSLIGSLFAAGVSIETLLEKSKNLKWNHFGVVHLNWGGMISAEALRKFMGQYIKDLKFSDLKIPFRASATDLLTGKRVIFSSGRVIPAVEASCSVPGVYHPVKYKKHLLIDGAFTGLLPTDEVAEMGAEVVLAVDVIPNSAMRNEPRNVIEILDRSVDIGMKQFVRIAKPKADFLIEPVTEDIRSLELDRAEHLIHLGEVATLKILPALKKKLLLS